ncbi:MAG: 4-hydroxy-3-methylbut-2-enyl diphosphate reductase [Ruminococcus sp.]|jgi:4-hydroxy-3-methylbut-2-enyl diphosphate reductase|nr:4-hydroxy-3-methylbut-2-enyl diphosphate reductase [Ruminococcus sp.]
MNYNIIIDKYAGFCFGVARAVSIVEKAVSGNSDNPGKIYTFGDIIHNSRVVENLREKGVYSIEYEQFRDLTSKDTVIIRSHGVPERIFDELHEIGVNVIDGTCPFVKKIHNIVSEYSSKGYEIIIFGDRSHAEIIGIVGNCQNTPHIYADFNDFLDKTDNFKYFFQKKLAFISQTTYNIIDWEQAVSKIKLHSSDFCDLRIFNTVCDATIKRQHGAKNLSESCDITVVVGDNSSSNTRKLYDICAKNCTAYITDGKDLTGLRRCATGAISLLLSRLSDTLGKTLTVGITAGASAPREVIEEVYNLMDDSIKDVIGTAGVEETGAAGVQDGSDGAEESFESMLNANLNRRVHKGNRVVGVITGFHNNEVTVDIGTKQTGFVPLEEFSEIPDEDPKQNAKVGEEVELIVTQVNDAEGWVTLSKSKADARTGFDALQKALNNNEVLDAVITDVVKGGVVAAIKGVRVFIPASHSGIRTNRNDENADKALDVLFKKPVRIKIIELDEKRNKAVGSIREAMNIERTAAKDKFWSDAAVGKTYTGTVRSVTNYGAFVDLGGVDGMIHLSELSWDKVTHPSQVVKVGDSVDVTIKALDPEKNRISLTYKDPNGDPFSNFLSKFEVGMDIPVKVVSTASFGAFAEIIPGVDGLIHISQFPADKGNALKKDDEVTARITEIDADRKRISLSIRAISEDAPVDENVPYVIPEETE